MGWILPAIGVAMSGAGLGMSIFGGGGVDRPDITGELRRISELYAQARAEARTAINQEAAAGRGTAASNLAARGTYRSPVAQNVFNAIETARLQSIGKSEGALAGQEAGTLAGALNSLLGYDIAAQKASAQKTAGIATGLTSLGSSLLMAYMMRQPTASPQALTLPQSSLTPTGNTWAGGNVAFNNPGFAPATNPFSWYGR